MASQATGAPGTEPGREMDTHFTVIAILNLVFAVPVLGFGMVIFFGALVGAGFVGALGDVPGLGALIASAGLVVGLGFVLLALPGLVSAIGLLQRRSWAKIWTIVAGALSLVNFPIGTAFGVYAIWAMTRPETEARLGDARSG